MTIRTRLGDIARKANKRAVANVAMAASFHTGRRRRGLAGPDRWLKYRMKTALAIFTAILSLLFSGCANSARTENPNRYNARPPLADVAVNLGIEHAGDLERLCGSLASNGVPVGMRAMSLNAEQIVVERADFDRAKAILEQIIARERLTVRVYKSLDFGGTAASSMLEVWEEGQKVREEEYRLY